jgi:hypothetical protein
MNFPSETRAFLPAAFLSSRFPVFALYRLFCPAAIFSQAQLRKASLLVVLFTLASKAAKERQNNI